MYLIWLDKVWQKGMDHKELGNMGDNIYLLIQNSLERGFPKWASYRVNRGAASNFELGRYSRPEYSRINTVSLLNESCILR